MNMKKVAITGASRTGECKNTEFVWEWRKTGFCESSHKQSCLLFKVSIRRAFTVVSFDTPSSQQAFYIHLWSLRVHVYSQLIFLISFHMSNMQRLVSLAAVFVSSSNRRSFV